VNREALENLPPVVWLLLAGAVVLGWLLSVLWRSYRRYRARRGLVSAITSVASDHLANVLVPDGMGGVFHVDFLLLTSRGIIVIDLRDIRGNIFAGDQMNQWTVMDGAQRLTFGNPQSSLYDRVAAVKALADEVPVEGRIVFTRRGKFPKGLPKWTLMIDSMGTEFPAVDRQAVARNGDPYAPIWANVKRAVRPSRLNRPKPAKGLRAEG
jgi:Nuclease-related domain